MATISSGAPNPTDPYAFRTMIQDRFQYALNADETTWDAWAAMVDDSITYNVTDAHSTARGKFSSFIIQWQCLTTVVKDGCCLFSDNYGPMCTFIKGDVAEGTTMETYRMSQTQWDTVATAGATNRSLVYDNLVAETLMDTKSANGTGLLYFDQMYCALNSGEDGFKFTCTAWQVNWKDGDETDGYGRYGLDETVAAVFIDASETSASEAIALTSVSLKSAITSVAVTMTGIAAALLISF